MKVEKKVIYEEKSSLINTIQYIIAVMISICFAISLIPFQYYKVSVFLIPLLLIQTLLSLLRLRLVNVILELFLIFLSLLSLIPFLGYLFRIIGFILSVLDLSMFKSTVIYRKAEIIKETSFMKNFGKKNKSKKKKDNFEEAEFKEK